MPLADRDQPRVCPFGPNERLDLHPTYQQLRHDQPLCRVRLPYGEPAWLLTRYADVRAALADPDLSRAQAVVRDQPRMIPDIIPMGMMDMDAPDHSRIRRLVSKAFTMRGAERLRPYARRRAAELVEAMVDAGPPAELVRDFALPLTMSVICELLGVRYEDRSGFAQWVAEATSAEGTAESRFEGLRKQMDYMAGLVAQCRREPTDDLLGAMVLARDEDDRLSEEELVLISMGLLAAGFETTASEIANFAYLLLTRPDQLTVLRERPELLPDAIEELLRFAPLIAHPGIARYATRDITLGGQVIPEGDAVLAFTPSANRDDTVFPDADRLDVTRPAGGHLTFGHGAHYCVGAQLARMELHVALGELINGLPGLDLAVPIEDVPWRTSVLIRGPEALSVTWPAG